MVRRPYPTYRDQTYPPTAAVWRALRELRAAPPGYASSGSRQKLFSSALEQSEQLFTAAASVGPASRPLVLFYGLSQAGRAIAACAPVPMDKCRLNGHGISATRMDQPDLGSVIIKDKGAAGTESFTQVAAMLGSRSLPEETRLADVWAAILEVNLWPLQSTTHPQLSISRETHQVDANTLQAMVSGLPGDLQKHSDPKDRERAVGAWLVDYPALNGYRFRSIGAIPDNGPESWDERQGTIGCRIVWDVEHGEEAAKQKFAEIAPWKGRSLTDSARVIHARFGGDDRQLHPLLGWWSVLFALSMLARYQPGQWTAQIDVNRSRDAVAIEYLLDSALAAVPELVLAAIDEITA
ncbi:YaaC family protein [Streptomyces sp. NPDC048410]|uniref:YaaC family protein n=1 Tax=Streptomyces sp. NPDC048410 TaxID=3365545 RepID=UPI00371AC731